MESTATLIVREVAFWLTLARLDQFLRKRATRSKTRELVWPSYSIATCRFASLTAFRIVILTERMTARKRREPRIKRPGDMSHGLATGGP
jgi:hypothetical protein